MWNIHTGHSLPTASETAVYIHLHKQNLEDLKTAKTVSLWLWIALANDDHVIGSRDNVDPKYPAASIFFNGTKIIEIRQETMEKEDKVVWGVWSDHTPQVSLPPVRVL